MCIMEITGLCTGMASTAVTGEAWLIGEIIEAHLGTATAVLVVLGITAGLFGILPRLMTLVGWLAVAVIAIVDVYADLLDLPDWLRALSRPWTLATKPAEDFDPAPFFVLLALAAVTVVIGLAGFRRREINIR